MNHQVVKEKIANHLTINDDTIVALAPGRINLIGGHTDYNKGLVLPGAIDKYFYFALNPRTDDQINITAIDLDKKYSFTTDQLQKHGELWVDFLIGLLIEFKKSGVELKGFDCALTSDVPIGSGMSSSSALECSILTALNEYFDCHCDPWKLIEMSQSSNHKFIGVQGGILDQFSSLFGKENHVMYLDCDTLKYNYIDYPTSQYTWLVINSCVKHDNLTSGYNDRVSECNNAVNSIKRVYPDIRHLSDIKDTDALKEITFENETVRKRAQFIVEENNRVTSYVSALKLNDFKTCGELLYACHEGLSNQYEVSCAELDFLVDILRDEDAVLGSRMMGGGFGGCTLNLVDKSHTASIKDKVKNLYFQKWNIEPELYLVNISDGARIINS